MKKAKYIFIIALFAVSLQNCAIVRPGEVGVDVHFGKTKEKLLEPGPHHFMAIFGRKIVRFDTRVINFSKKINFHAKEGIEIESEITASCFSGGTRVIAPLSSPMSLIGGISDAMTGRQDARASRTLNGDVSPRSEVKGATSTSLAWRYKGIFWYGIWPVKSIACSK